MADLTTAQKAPLIVDGEPLAAWDAITSSDPAIVSIAPTDGIAHAIGNAAGAATVTVTKGGRSGGVVVNVTEAPLVVELGTPIPK